MLLGDLPATGGRPDFSFRPKPVDIRVDLSKEARIERMLYMHGTTDGHCQACGFHECECPIDAEGLSRMLLDEQEVVVDPENGPIRNFKQAREAMEVLLGNITIGSYLEWLKANHD